MGDFTGGNIRGWDMATVAARAPKRELAPDWRDALRDAVRRLAIRTWGALLVALSFAGAVALATHNPTDPSLSTAAGGPPTNWLGSARRLFQRCACCCCSGSARFSCCR